jgi:uncharacterized protein YcbK (DUF882 family)
VAFGVRKPSLRFALRASVSLGLSLGLAGIFLLGSHNSLQTAVAEGDTRTLSFHHLHTGEDITITFKRNGRYDDAALKKLDWFMRDWRKEQSVSMDPHLFDLLWEAYREVDATAPIQVVCGYRSPETNSMLRARSSGVAELSQHTAGHAMDFFIPGVALDKLRSVGLRMQRGGVGFYPSSGSPFVHLDTGTVRHWPRMTHDQLVKIFPDGRTVHVPSDGVPLKNYALALADVEARGNEPSATSLAAARDNGITTAGAGKPQRSLFASLFGSKSKDADEADDDPAAKPTYTTASAPAPTRAKTPVAVASLTVPKPVATESIVPLPAARPKSAPVAVAATTPAQPQMTLASLPNEVFFDNRGYWRGSIDGNDQAQKAQAKASPFDVASADNSVVGSTPQALASTPQALAGTPQALAYAPEKPTPLPVAAPARVRPMGAKIPAAPAAMASTSAPFEVFAVGPAYAPALSGGTQKFESPWMRAAMLAPSVGLMKTTRVGPLDSAPLRELLHKPAQSLVMTFSADPHLGMTTASLSGTAVVFLATATFARQTTASLR